MIEKVRPMVFSSFSFIAFFLPIVIILHFLSKNIHWRNAVLLVASVFFYSWGEPVWVLSMLFSIFVNYGFGLAIDRSSSPILRKIYLGLAAAVSLFFLVYFKYSAFFENTFYAIIGSGVMVPSKTLPIGISFFTFQILTYTVDVYRKKTPVQRNPFLLILYISFFPQLIAGPIVQYGDIEPMLRERTTSSDKFANGMKRFVIGLAKKILLANLCGKALASLSMAGSAEGLSVAGAWVGMVLFALQIYFDFSGYSDMALGMASSFGFDLKENFNYPYISKSITDFWRRWHMSLGAFFRDYVYIPMGGNRVNKPRMVFNLAFVWALTGMWHGASWNFIVWGVYYGVIIILERLVWGRALEKLPGAVQIAYALVLVLVGWALFYYEDLSLGLRHISAMFGVGANGFIDGKTLFTLKDKALFLPLALLACTPVRNLWNKAVKAAQNRKGFWAGALPAAQYVVLSALLLLTLLALVGQSFNPFLYFRF
jgi:alginate O-acetyltransferase complex protein AlgI